jgi:hypothetical protein
VAHPALDVLGISKAVLIGITTPKNASFDGGKTIEFKFMQNVHPGTKRVTKAVASNTTVVKEYDPNAQRPANEAPTPPSKNAANLTLNGPKPKAVP